MCLSLFRFDIYNLNGKSTGTKSCRAQGRKKSTKSKTALHEGDKEREEKEEKINI